MGGDFPSRTSSQSPAILKLNVLRPKEIQDLVEETEAGLRAKVSGPHGAGKALLAGQSRLQLRQ